MFHRFALLLALVLRVSCEIGLDYITEAPLTVYEAEELSPQNLDYDKVNRAFPAHAGWYNDRLIHYYKFRIFAPPTYPDVITPQSTSQDVPLQKIYMVTTDGSLDGVVGNPIIEYHHADGVEYSDFMEIVLVQAPQNYIANTYKSEGDIVSEAAVQEPTGIVMNIPVVPTNSTLQEPATKSDDVVTPAQTGLPKSAPIRPTVVWYKGLEVWTYVFEVTDQTAADFFASTRDDPADSAYSIPVVTTYATPDAVFAIPLTFLNQFTVGVTTSNFGGPSDTGMRNILNLDRGDAGYSPLWQLLWVTKLPINYSADQVSNTADMTKDAGFETIPTPIFVNCPNIGTVGSNDNPLKLSVFQTVIDKSQEANWILGTDASLILTPEVPVEFQANGDTIASTKTNMQGAYEYNLASASIPEGTQSIDVVVNGTVIRSVPIQEEDTGSTGTSGSSSVLTNTFASMIIAVIALLV